CSSWRGLQSDASTPDDSRLITPETTPPSIPTNSATARSPIGKHELALVVGAPQFIRLGGARERRALSPVTSSGLSLDQAMAIEHRMHCADRGRVHIRIKPGQSFPDLRRPPARLVLLDAHDQRLDLDRELIGMAIRPARAVGEPFQACRV